MDTMYCHECKFMRRIDLPYRTAYNDMLCCHPDIAIECGWRYAGAIIINDGETPGWCPEHETKCIELET